MKLTPKQMIFTKEYLVDLNATQAAIRSGYSKKTANRIASQLLSKIDIQQSIQQEMKARAERTDLTIDRVLLEYKRLALHDIRRAYNDDGILKPVHEWDDDTAAAIAGLETKELYEGTGDTRVNVGVLSAVKLSDKRAALCDVMRHLGGFEKDNNQQNGRKAIVVADIKDLSAEDKMKALQSIL